MKHWGICVGVFALEVAGITLAQGGNLSDDLYNVIRTDNLARLEALVAGGASVDIRGVAGVTPLMDAAAVGSLDAMKLLIAKGADVNAQDAGGRTALIRSATDLAKVRLLLDHGANVNAASKHGRTVLLAAAMSDHSAELVRFLIAKGADVKAVDSLKTTALLAACIGNDTATIQMMIDAGINVNPTPRPADLPYSLTPLMLAATNGNLPAVKMLLAKGAKVNAVSEAESDGLVKNGPIALGNLTPLLVTVPFGQPELVSTLLEAGAGVNAKDVRGLTPLMLAVATDHHQDPEVIRMLLERGADVNAKSLAGETALDWAKKMGRAAAVEMLTKAGAVAGTAPRVTPPAPSPMELRPAVERGIALLEKTSADFYAKGGCISCHAQNIADLAVATARAKGIRVNAKAADERTRLLKVVFATQQLDLLERIDADVPEIQGYAMAAFGAANYPPDRATDAMAVDLAARQAADGAWRFGVAARPPIMDGYFTRTALMARALKIYGPPGRGVEMAARIAKARQWLMAATPETAEDRNMQLLGLAWSGAESSVLKRLANAIVAAQQPDGGWRQHAGLASDAYATGESLYTLITTAGTAPADPVYKKGVQFLLSTQRADGSWYVASRAPKFQPYFESGFPYGHDQWISMMATGWATMALAQAIEGPVTRAAR